MVMTKALAKQLMDSLACVALSATGGVDPNNINQKQVEYAENYAREIFCDLLHAWEEITDEEWEIEEE